MFRTAISSFVATRAVNRPIIVGFSRNCTIQRQVLPKFSKDRKYFFRKLPKPGADLRVFPNNSQDPLIAKAQHDLFHNIESYHNIASGQKELHMRYDPKRKESHYEPYENTTWRKARNYIKNAAKNVRKQPKPYESETRNTALYLEHKKTSCFAPKWLARQAKLTLRKKKGKKVVRKGQGKRALAKK